MPNDQVGYDLSLTPRLSGVDSFMGSLRTRFNEIGKMGADTFRKTLGVGGIAAFGLNAIRSAGERLERSAFEARVGGNSGALIEGGFRAIPGFGAGFEFGRGLRELAFGAGAADARNAIRVSDNAAIEAAQTQRHLRQVEYIRQQRMDTDQQLRLVGKTGLSLAEERIRQGLEAAVRDNEANIDAGPQRDAANAASRKLADMTYRRLQQEHSALRDAEERERKNRRDAFNRDADARRIEADVETRQLLRTNLAGGRAALVGARSHALALLGRPLDAALADITERGALDLEGATTESQRTAIRNRMRLQQIEARRNQRQSELSGMVAVGSPELSGTYRGVAEQAQAAQTAAWLGESAKDNAEILKIMKEDQVTWKRIEAALTKLGENVVTIPD